MSITVFRIVPNKETVLTEPEEAPTLEVLQKLVGGYIEIVYLKNGSQLVVNEDGHAQELPFNEEASRLSSNIIVGNAVVLSGEHKID